MLLINWDPNELLCPQHRLWEYHRKNSYPSPLSHANRSELTYWFKSTLKPKVFVTIFGIHILFHGEPSTENLICQGVINTINMYVLLHKIITLFLSCLTIHSIYFWELVINHLKMQTKYAVINPGCIYNLVCSLSGPNMEGAKHSLFPQLWTAAKGTQNLPEGAYHLAK